MATINDVAKLAGVTPTTVSRCINNRGYISEKTRKRIYECMDELNYRPNEVARSLSMQRTNTISIIVPDVEHPYYSTLIGYLEGQANKYGYKVLLCSSRWDLEKKRILLLCQSNRVSGIVICGAANDKILPNIGIPVVQVEKRFSASIPTILCDNWAGGTLAAQTLIEAGCKNLLHIGSGINEAMSTDDRAAAFAELCEQNGVRHAEARCPITLDDDEGFIQFIRNLIVSHPGLDGIFASSDMIACRVNLACYQMGIRIPQDIKLVGFDDVYISHLSVPPITTIHQPLKEIAEAAIVTIDNICNDRPYEMETVLPVTLVRRDSV